MRTLWRLAAAKGWRVVPEGADYDALLVNGEGNMHHGSKRFHHKMRLLGDAVAAGRPAFLVNSAWQDNPPDYDDMLPRLSGLFVREVLSQRELAERHGARAEVLPDASFFDRLPWFTWRRNFRGRPAVTDFFAKPARCGPPPPLRAAGQPVSRSSVPALPRLALGTDRRLAADGELPDHRSAPRGLRGLRRPCAFVASEGNTHKIRGLIASADVYILVAETPRNPRNHRHQSGTA